MANLATSSHPKRRSRASLAPPGRPQRWSRANLAPSGRPKRQSRVNLASSGRPKRRSRANLAPSGRSNRRSKASLAPSGRSKRCARANKSFDTAYLFQNFCKCDKTAVSAHAVVDGHRREHSSKKYIIAKGTPRPIPTSTRRGAKGGGFCFLYV